MRKAYSYIRYSTGKQKTGTSERQQKKAIDRWLKDNPGYTLDTELKDLGVSSFKGRNLDKGALSHFLKAIEDGLVDEGSVLLASRLDRLSRLKPRKTLDVLGDILEAGVDIVLVDENERLTKENADDIDKLMTTLMRSYLAHEESKKKSERCGEAWSDKRDRLKESGEKLTTQIPMWLTAKSKKEGRHVKVEGFSIDKEKANVVKRIFKHVAEGNSLNATLKWLHDNNIKPLSQGKRKNSTKTWGRSSLSRLLKGRQVLGELTPANSTPITDYYPRIIDEETFDRVQFVLQENKTKRGSGKSSNRNLFSGFIFSANDNCELYHYHGRLVSKNHRNKVPGSTKFAVSYEAVEEVVLMALAELEFVPAPNSKRASKPQRRRVLIDKIDALQNEMERADASSVSFIAKALSDTQAKLDALNNEVAQEAPKRLNRRDYTDRHSLRLAVMTMVRKITLELSKDGQFTQASGVMEMVDGQKWHMTVAPHIYNKNKAEHTTRYDDDNRPCQVFCPSGTAFTKALRGMFGRGMVPTKGGPGVRPDVGGIQ